MAKVTRKESKVHLSKLRILGAIVSLAALLHVYLTDHNSVWLKRSVSESLPSSFIETVQSHDPCATRSLYVLCKYYTADAETACYRDPLRFLNKRYQAYSPSEGELGARDMMHKNGLSALSVGANKFGLCNDVRPSKTFCTDRPQLDLFRMESWMSILDNPDTSVPIGLKALFAEHVLEHFTPVQVTKLAAAAFLALRPGGTFRVAVPDGYKPSNDYQIYVRAGSTHSGHGQTHMTVWTVDSLPTIFEDLGFEIKHREHFDDHGVFQTSERAYASDNVRGKVHRSFRHDKRNIHPMKDFHSRIGNLTVAGLGKDEPMYTSLWFDAVKPMSCEANILQRDPVATNGR